MPTLSERNNVGDLLKFEAPNLYSREQVTLAAGQALVMGTVLSQRTADGQYHALAPAATDGTEVAVGILAFDTDATLVDRDDTVVIARHATVARIAVVWPAGITPAERELALQQLDARGIVVRASA